MNKKTVIGIICIAVAVVIVAVGAVLLLSKGGVISSAPTITVENAKGNKGDVVSVPVKISGNPGFMAMMVDFEYDKDALKYIGYDEGNVISNYQFAEDEGKVKMLNLEDADTKKNGTLLSLKFEILTDNSQDSEVKVVAGDDSVCNSQEELIKVKTKNGKITLN